MALCLEVLSWERRAFLFLVTLVAILNVASTDSVCKGGDNDPCKCALTNGSGTIDLSTIGKKGAAAFTNLDAPGDYFDYSYNPCYAFSYDDGEGDTLDGLAALQCDEEVSTCYDIGVQTSSVFFQDSGGEIGINYTEKNGGSDPRTSVVWIKCDKSTKPVKVTAKGETGVGTGIYEFEMTGADLCLGSKSSSGLSGGSIVLIIFFVLVFVYLLIGIIYNKSKNDATGTDMIPNKSFWASLPGLIKEGFMFLVYKCKGQEPPSYDNI